MSPLEPAVSLMSRLRYPQKFVLVSLVFAVPLALMMFLWLGELRDRIAFASDERIGLEYVVPLRRLLESLVLARDPARAQVQSLAAVAAGGDMVDGRIGDRLHCHEAWSALHRRLGDGAAPPASAVPETRRLIAHVGDTSKLILDPVLDSYYLMDE